MTSAVYVTGMTGMGYANTCLPLSVETSAIQNLGSVRYPAKYMTGMHWPWRVGYGAQMLLLVQLLEKAG